MGFEYPGRYIVISDIVASELWRIWCCYMVYLVRNMLELLSGQHAAA